MAPQRAFSESLARLRSELAMAHTLPTEERERLETLLEEVIRSAEGDGGDEEDSIAHHLQEAMERFEESHPTLTHAIGAVAEALSRLGV